MKIYHSVSEVFSDRRGGISLSEVVENILHSPRVLEQLETPFDVILNLQEGDYLDASSQTWGGLSHDTQVRYAKAYQTWYAKMFGVLNIEAVEKIDARTDIALIFIPPMRFIMGTPLGSGFDDFREAPHIELVDYPYWLGKYEVTYGQWRAITQGQGDLWSGNWDEPVTFVNIAQAKAFCKKLKMQLPNEIEWELACRAGTTSTWYFGNDIGYLKDHAWTIENSEGFPQPVGGKSSNPFGLFDMYGNVWEWCRNNQKFEERNISRGDPYMVRGGSYLSGWYSCRSSYRGRIERGAITGFRVMRKA